MNFIIKNIFKNKLNLFLFILLIIILFLIVLIALDYYPVLIVNNNLITSKEVILNTKAALSLYENYKKIELSQLNDQGLIKDISYNDVKAIVLNELIERILIHNEVKQRLGEDLPVLVNEKLNYYLTPEIEKAGSVIYNLNKKDFINEILIPQAERDILTGRLFLENKKIDDWLNETKAKSEIIIFDPKFKWDNKQVVLNKNNDK